MSYSMYDYLAGNRGGMTKRASAPSRNCVNVLRKIAAGSDPLGAVDLINTYNAPVSAFMGDDGGVVRDVDRIVARAYDNSPDKELYVNVFGPMAKDYKTLLAAATGKPGEDQERAQQAIREIRSAIIPGVRGVDQERNGVFDPRSNRVARKAFNRYDKETEGGNRSSLLPGRGIGEFTEDLLDNYGSHLAYGGAGLGLGALAGALGYKKNRLLGGLIGGAGGAGLGLLTKYLVDQYGGKVGEWIAKKKAERAGAAK